jgi:hypothetical protein
MNKAETIAKLKSVAITRHDLNSEAFDAFVKRMRRYQYGVSETAQAYNFFVQGWMAAKRTTR